MPPTTLVADNGVSTATYHVGNSLTWGTLGYVFNELVSLSVLARQADSRLEPVGYHINCGASLINTVENPQQTCVEPDGSIGLFTDALSSRPWDAITVQPYPGPESTLASDVAAIRELMQLSSDASGEPTTTLYVLTGWPGHASYADTWTAASANADETPTVVARSYFEHLVGRLRATTDTDVFLIPIGEVLLEMDRRFASGSVPGYTSVSDLYGDEIHLNSRGQWIAGLATVTTMLGIDPSAFGKTKEPWYGENEGFTLELIQAARDAVRDVVLTEEFSGRASLAP